MNIKEFFMYVHQLPQNILGLLVKINNFKRIKVTFNDGKSGYIYKTVNFSGSFGKYICIDARTYNIASHNAKYLSTLINHEHGHQVQSLYFGWLYLLIIGLPSVCNNIISRIKGKNGKYSQQQLDKWYYNLYPEKWANKLAGVAFKDELYTINGFIKFIS